MGYVGSWRFFRLSGVYCIVVLTLVILIHLFVCQKSDVKTLKRSYEEYLTEIGLEAKKYKDGSQYVQL